ncbi:MAG TPA: hypothetical protein VGL45_09700 [Bradyrhizobium sp.]|jgi:hypothetical protein
MPNPALGNTGSYSDNVATTLAVTNTSFAMFAGDVVIIPLATYCDTVVPGQGTVADNKGNTFTWLCGKSNSTTDRCRIDLFASPPLAAGYGIGTYTVTATANGSNGANTEQGFNIQRWTGFGALGAALDVSGVATSAAATSTATVTLSGPTAQQAVEAVICCLHFNDSNNPDGLSTPTGTGTWSLDFANGNATIGLACSCAHQVTSATGTAYSATWSGLDTTTNNGGSMLIAALYPAAAAGAQVPHMPYAFQPTMAQ